MSLVPKQHFQSRNNTQNINTFRNFQAPIGNEKYVESFEFQNDAPILKYCQKSLHSCCFSSLASAIDSINHNKAESSISLRIEESLESEVGSHIDFANDILKNKKGDTKVHYSLIKYKQKCFY